MQQTKTVFLSKGVVGGGLTLIMGLLMVFGAVQPGSVEIPAIDGVDPNVVGEILQVAQGGGALIVGVLTMAFGALALVGRLLAKKNLQLILLITCSLLFAAGCSRVRMTAAYAQALEQSAIVVGELDNRCQAGDAAACKEGLHKATETLDLLVDALHGVDSREEVGHE